MCAPRMLIRVCTYLHVRAHDGCIIAEPRGIRIVSINQSADRICRLEGRKRERKLGREKKRIRVDRQEREREKYELDFFPDALTFHNFQLDIKIVSGRCINIDRS